MTATKTEAADARGQVDAIGKSQAVVEFAMDGTILGANDGFLHAMGYTLEEVQGQHHRMFVDAAERGSAAYIEFWEQLNRGVLQRGEYRRIGKGGREVWIQASYNPILDLSGRPFKVVKYATDVTAQARARIEIMQIVASLGGAAKELTGISESMSTAATQTVAQSGIVLGSARVVSQNIQDVAAGTEEMSASIREISVSAQSSARVAKAAVTTANETNVTITKLGESSAEIGKVIKVITTIAQ